MDILLRIFPFALESGSSPITARVRYVLQSALTFKYVPLNEPSTLAAMPYVYSCADPAQREEGLAVAADVLREGELVVLPTDTVYGIGADAFHRAAPRRVLAAKRRGPEMPLPVLVDSEQMARGLTLILPDGASQLMEAFWPGALTIVIRSSPTLDWNLGETDGTVAVRAPDHPVALDLIKRVGPMAVSSANLSGQPAATTINQARVFFDDIVEVYLDGGRCADSVPSTIVDLTPEGAPRVLREGALSIEQLREVVPGIQVVGSNGGS